VVGLPPHAAIGTGALAVALNAFINLLSHARAGHVRWREGSLFAVAGVIGAAIGSSLGKKVDGQRLLFLFALLMIAVGVQMLRVGKGSRAPDKAYRFSFARLAGFGFGVGVLAGFFGIGGGFLIVPGLRAASNLSMIEAIGSSLLSVGAFGLTAAVNYALSGLVVWPVAGEFILGGIVGGLLGLGLARTLAHRRGALQRVFAAVVLLVALYLLWRSVPHLFAA
jgi:uncharacterized membrane protein YfcA